MRTVPDGLLALRVRQLLAEYDSPAPFGSSTDAADLLGELVAAARPLVAMQHVEFDWSCEHGECYECGLPAAFRLTGHPSYDTKPDDPAGKRCAICAANDAADGEQVARLFED